MKITYFASAGAADPTRASIPFHLAANGSLEVGQETAIILGGDAAELGAVAGAVAAASGSIWGPALRAANGARGIDGVRDDAMAYASVRGRRYSVGCRFHHSV